MTTPRGAMLHLIDSRPWTIPHTTADAEQFHRTLPPLMRMAHQLHGDDRIARLVSLRLDVFLAHWPHPPTSARMHLFRSDVEGLVQHDVPRIRQQLLWAPADLPGQRAPRLGVTSLDTA